MYVVDNTSQVLIGLSISLKDRAQLHKFVATALTNLVKDHFAQMAMTNRNKFGVRSTFWRRQRAACKSDWSDTAAAVVMNREVAQRFYGGTITPKKSKWLTIPQNRKAYGKAARFFKDLRVVKLKTGGLGLFRFVKDQDPELYYLLRKSVNQLGSSDVLPTPEQIEAATRTIVTQYLTRRGLA